MVGARICSWEGDHGSARDISRARAVVVCQAFDLDSTTRSADYIQLYRGTTDTLAESLDFIQKCSVSIIDAIRQLQDSATAA